MDHPIGRRTFLQSGAVAAVGLAGQTRADEPQCVDGPQAILEPAREVPVVDTTDVVVCGGGPAGVAAAIAAARAGASVRLIEAHGQLGGIWTTGLLSWIIDAGNKKGIMQQITDRLNQRVDVAGGRRWDGRGSIPYDVEQMKLVLDQMCDEADVRIRLHTRVTAAIKDKHSRITHCVTESPSGREAFAAKVFIDCTGNGDLAALAGCGFDFGRPDSGRGSAGPERAGETQPFSLMMLITGIDPVATEAYREKEGRSWAEPKDALKAQFRKAGVEPSYGAPTIFQIHHDLYAWMINHEYGYSGISAEEITAATRHARRELHEAIDALRTLGPPWQDIKIVATGSQIGIREGRRIRGRYTVSLDDMLAGARHKDAVCRVTFGIDVHSTNVQHSTAIEAKPVKQRTQPYDIPLRALIAHDVDGLMMAGRCISGDFLAHSSYRVTGNAVTMGQAAGITASLAAEKRCLPHEVAWTDIADQSESS